MQVLHLGAESPDIYISHPLALLYRTAKECEPFRRVLQNTLRKHPCSVSNPWRVVIYFDEITPTDPCSAKVDRHKLQGFYWTFMELGDISFDDKIWFVVSCSPSVGAAKLEGGMSQLVKHVLRKCFFDNAGFNLETSGIFLDESAGMDVPVRLFARHAYTICDFNALKALLQTMGQSGLKPCPSCSNVVKDDLAVHGDLLVPLSSLDPDTWKRHTDKSVVDLQDYLRAQKPLISATTFAELESRLGYHYLPTSILLDRVLNYKAMSTLRYDWAHCYFSSGIFGKELDAFVEKARQCSPRGRPPWISYRDFHDYMSSWPCPACWSSCENIFRAWTHGCDGIGANDCRSIDSTLFRRRRASRTCLGGTARSSAQRLAGVRRCGNDAMRDKVTCRSQRVATRCQRPPSTAWLRVVDAEISPCFPYRNSIRL